MEKNVKRVLRFRLLAFIAVFGIIFAMNAKQVYAGGDVDLDGIIQGANSTNGTFYSGDKFYVTMDDLDGKYGGSGTFKTLFDKKIVKAKIGITDGSGNTEYRELIQSTDKKTLYYMIQPSFFGKYVFLTTEGEDSHYNNNSRMDEYLVSAYIDCSVNKNTGIATIKGGITGISAKFDGIKIDGAHITTYDDKAVGTTSMNFTLDVKKYTVGYHSLGVRIKDSADKITECNYLYKMLSGIYEAPKLAAKWFDTESNYFIMSAPSFNSASRGSIYIDYKKGSNGKWQTQYGPFNAGSSGKIAGLSPNTTYYVRAYYVKPVEFSGSTLYIIGPVSSTVAIKTGPSAKPAIKSVKISKAKVKKVWVKPILNAFGFVVKKGFWTKETTYKVTIKFKKKPNVAGIEVYAGGVTLPKYLKGNKLTYTTKFTVGGKAIGKKTKFKIRTKGNATYGRWSPFITKSKIKIKK